MNFIKTAKEHTDELIISLCEIAVGLLLLFDPVRFTSGIIVAFGVLLAVLGAASIIRYFTTEPRQAAKEQRLSKGLFLLGAGLFCILKSSWFISTFPALTVLYGAGLMLIGFIKIQRTVDMLRMKREMWFISAISAAASLLVAAIILVNPFKTTLFLWILIGVTLIAQAACDLMSIFLKKRQKNNPPSA